MKGRPRPRYTGNPRGVITVRFANPMAVPAGVEKNNGRSCGLVRYLGLLKVVQHHDWDLKPTMGCNNNPDREAGWPRDADFVSRVVVVLSPYALRTPASPTFAPRRTMGGAGVSIVARRPAPGPNSCLGGTTCLRAYS